MPPALRRSATSPSSGRRSSRTGFASQMLAVAIGWQVYAIHRNPLDLGLVGLMEFLPLPLLALPAGQTRRPPAAARCHRGRVRC